MRRVVDVSARRQVQLGKRLAGEKLVCVAAGLTWKSYVKEHCGMSRERADELIRIGRGLLTVEKARTGKKLSTRASRQKMQQPVDKDLILGQVRRATDACARITKRRYVHKLPRTDVDEVSRAIREAIAAWEGLLQDMPRSVS